MSELATREDAVAFAASVIRRSTDWQQVQDAMANNDRIRAWLDAEEGGELSAYQSVIREAEERLGDKLPENYA